MKQPIILRVFRDASLVEVKQFDQDQIVFGRPGAEVDVFLDDDSVSPIHCLIEKRDGEYRICDLGSQSGVYLNKTLVLDDPIESGQQVQIGQFRIEFFVGVPKPKTAPVVASSSPETTSKPPVTKSPEPVAVVKETAAPKKPEIPTATQKPAVPVKVELPAEPASSIAKPGTSSAGGKTKAEASVTGKKWHRKKATISPKSEITSLTTYLKPTSGNNIQVLTAWKERVLESYDFNRKKKVIIAGSSRSADVKLPIDIARTDYAFARRNGDEIDVLIPQGSVCRVISASNTFSQDDLKRLGRLQTAQGGFTLRVQNQEVVQIVHDSSSVEVFVRRTPEGLPIKPLGFIDLSSTELTGLIVSFVLVSLVALYMSVYTPPEKEELVTEEVRLAQFVYNRPPSAPTPPPPPPPEPEEPTPPPPPPPKQEPKRIQVTEDKPQNQGAAQKAGAKAQAVRPKPSKIARTSGVTSVKQGGAVKIGQNEGANAASKEPDVSQSGLLGAFGGGGNRSRLDKAYSGSGELLGMANQATGVSGQNADREGDDIGSRFKDTGAGGKGVATQGISNLGTRGRSSGNIGYGAVGAGDGKGRVTIDVPGTNAEFTGTIDREAVRRVIRSILSQLRACYEKQLRGNPSLNGKLVITFEIVEQGRVTSSKPKSSTLGDPEVGRCVAARIQAQRFPEPPPGTIAVVDYPFVFDSQN